MTPEGPADELPVLPGRLQRLADELAEERLPALVGAPDRVAALVELAYALRPTVHEGRVPSYGVLLPTVDDIDTPQIRTALDTGIEVIPTDELDLRFARRFADGVTAFAVRSTDTIDRLVCFGRNLADEYDLVGLQHAIGGLVIQRHPGGQVRVFGPEGVVRWDGVAWHRDAPIDRWLLRLAAVADGIEVEALRPLLRFAVHELGARRIGATLIWRGEDAGLLPNRHEPLVHHAPRLRLDSVGEEAALAHALAQTDGAALFDPGCRLVALGIRLAPSPDAERAVPAMHGMRHTSALRYSHDDPAAVVVTVSEAGPVTVMHRGRTIESAGDATIG